MKPRHNRRTPRRPRAYYLVAGLDLRAEMERMCALEALGGATGPLARKPPTLTIRRPAKHPRSRLGVAWPDEHRLSVTAYPGIRASAVLETLCHELVHLYLGRGRGREGWHGARFKATLHAAITERFGIEVARAANAYHGHYAAAIERGLTAQARLFDPADAAGRAA
jgi:SprT-like family